MLQITKFGGLQRVCGARAIFFPMDSVVPPRAVRMLQLTALVGCKYCAERTQEFVQQTCGASAGRPDAANRNTWRLPAGVRSARNMFFQRILKYIRNASECCTSQHLTAASGCAERTQYLFPGTCDASTGRPNATNHNTWQLPTGVRSARNIFSHAVPPQGAPNTPNHNTCRLPPNVRSARNIFSQGSCVASPGRAEAANHSTWRLPAGMRNARNSFSH